MKDFGFPPIIGILDIVFIGPIPLFTSTVAEQIRKELFNKRVIKACLIKS